MLSRAKAMCTTYMLDQMNEHEELSSKLPKHITGREISQHPTLAALMP